MAAFLQRASCPPAPYDHRHRLRAQAAVGPGGYEYGPERSEIATTLRKFWRHAGRLVSPNRTGVSRPEVSALVLGALASTGFDETRRAPADVLESALAEGQDPVAVQRTYIVSAVMRGLIRSRPTSARLAQLRTALLSGAIQDPRHGNLLCWASRLETEEGEAGLPSVAHTAQAVVALIRASFVLGEEIRTHNAVVQALSWFTDRQDMGNHSEQIRRWLSDKARESLTVRHFTAAWLARAYSQCLEPTRSQQTTSWKRQCAGWDPPRRALGMGRRGPAAVDTYQGASVLRDYAMRSSVIPI